MPICKDPLTKMVADRGYTGVRFPRADIEVGALLGRQDGAVFELGRVFDAFDSAAAPVSPSSAAPASDFEGSSSSTLKAAIGLDVLDDLLRVIGGGASAKAAYQGAKEVTFQIRGVTTISLPPLQLDKWLEGAALRKTSPLLAPYVAGKGELFVVIRTLRSTALAVAATASGGSSFAADVPALGELIGARLNLDVSNNSQGKVTYQGATPVVFAFQAMRLSVGDGKVRLFNAAPAGALLAPKAPGAPQTRPLADEWLTFLPERRWCFCPAPEAAPKTSDRPRAALVNKYRWLTKNVRIGFLDGKPNLRNRVWDAAQEWLTATGIPLAFDRVTDAESAQVRISFEEGDGSWSLLGTDCLNHRQGPTMNFGWLSSSSSDEAVKSVVLHEFGHMLGLIHEHQNPNVEIPWDRPAVYAELGKPPNSWDVKTVDRNLFEPYDLQRATATSYDPHSIMHYPVPASWTGGKLVVGANEVLSKDDIALIREVYTKGLNANG